MILHASLNELWYPVMQTSRRHVPDIHSWPYLKETVSHKRGGPDKLVKSGKLNKSKASLRKRNSICGHQLQLLDIQPFLTSCPIDLTSILAPQLSMTIFYSKSSSKFLQ